MTTSDKTSWNAHITTSWFTFKFKQKIQQLPSPPFNVDLTYRIADVNVCWHVVHVLSFSPPNIGGEGREGASKRAIVPTVLSMIVRSF